MSNYTRESLSELTDIDLALVYRKFKNDKVKLFKLTNGDFSVRSNGSVLCQSVSQRYCTIEFILLCQQKRLGGESSLDFLKDMFGFGNVGGFR